MHMQQVQVFILNHAHHFAGKSQFVRWIFEQRIRAEINFVVEQVFVQEVEAAGLRIGDEVNFMTFLGKGLSEFSGNHTTTAEGRITDYSDLDLFHR